MKDLTPSNDNAGSKVIDLSAYLARERIQRYEISINGDGTFGLEGDFSLHDLELIVDMLKNIDLS